MMIIYGKIAILLQKIFVLFRESKTFPFKTLFGAFQSGVSNVFFFQQKGNM